MPKTKTGTPAGAGPYTEEQLAALEGMKKKGLALGAARKEFANNVLHADGTVTKSVKPVIETAKERVAKILKGDQSDPAVLQAAGVAAAKVKEIEAMVEEKRFLFVLDNDGIPVVYFQCATPGNPDVR